MAEDTEITPLDFNVLDAVPHTYRLLASGGVAGCVAKTATAPLSRLTILFQVRYLWFSAWNSLSLGVGGLVGGFLWGRAGGTPSYLCSEGQCCTTGLHRTTWGAVRGIREEYLQGHEEGAAGGGLLCVLEGGWGCRAPLLPGVHGRK